MSESRKDKKPFLGKTHSMETKQKMAKSHKGHTYIIEPKNVLKKYV